MPVFYATTPRGLEKVLERELKAIGIEKTKMGVAGVEFETNWAGCYAANLELVSASRVLYPVLNFPAYEPDQIYHNVLKHDWTKYIDASGTMAMDSSVRDSIIRDLRIVALKAKDAVADQFRNKFGERPNVDTENPDLQISLRLVKNQCIVSLDTSGGSLHQRGYRDRGAPAPLKENLAAALIKLTKWDEKSPLMDPMCGSGTFVIEAALMGLRRPPGIFRKRFAFQKWKTFQKDAFDKLSQGIFDRELSDVPFRVYGQDHDMRAIAAARANSENAETDNMTVFRRQDILEFRPAPTPGIVIVNPPYGERMGDASELVRLYENLGLVLRDHFKGWKAFVLTSEPDLARALTQTLTKKPHETHRVFNGAIECGFLGYYL